MTNINEWDEELQESGQQIGREWAQHSAERGELRRLRRFREALSREAAQCLEVLDIMSIIEPGSENHPQAAREYWEKIVGFRTDSDVLEPEFLLGFLQGSSQRGESDDTAQRQASPEANSPDQKAPMESDPGVEEFGKEYRSIKLDRPNSGGE